MAVCAPLRCLLSSDRAVRQFLCIVATSSILGLLGANTSWTDVEDTVHVRKSWDSISMSMGIEQTVVTWVSETLMPEESLSGSLDGRHQSIGLDVLMKG